MPLATVASGLGKVRYSRTKKYLGAVRYSHVILHRRLALPADEAPRFTALHRPLHRPTQAGGATHDLISLKACGRQGVTLFFRDVCNLLESFCADARKSKNVPENTFFIIKLQIPEQLGFQIFPRNVMHS